MKVSDLIAKKLSEYTDYAFTGQGGSVVHILDSLETQNKIKIIPSQNEQGASLAADAYTRTTGKIGLVIATSGPGILNTLQGMACSYYDSIPGIYISGAPVRSALKTNKAIRQVGFQEMDMDDIVKSFTKHSVRLLDPDCVLYEIDKAIDIAVSGRPGPVLIDLPDDIQRLDVSELNQKKFVKKENKIKIIDDHLESFFEHLKLAKRPLVIYGNGIKTGEAEELALKFNKKYQVPYSATWAVHDVFQSSDHNNVGGFGVYATRHGNFAVENSDVLIILGSRLNGTLTGSSRVKFSPKSKKIQIDIDENELDIENNFKLDLRIHGNVKDFLSKVLHMEKKININKEWMEEIQNWKRKYPVLKEKKEYEKQKKNINPYYFFNTLSKLTSEGDIIIPDASANLVWAYQSYQISKKQKIFTSLNHSPMGYSVAASLGAALPIHGNKNVIATIGDGSMQMNIQEIENIKNYNLPIKIFLINNQGYGMVKQTIDTWLDSKYVGCDANSGLSLPNFRKVFEAYGIKTILISNHSEMIDKINETLKFKGPIMCEVMVDENERIIPKTQAGSPLYDMQPRLSDEELKSNLINRD